MPTLEGWKTRLRADNPTLTKKVNGVQIDLTTQEYDDTIDGWAQAEFDRQEKEVRRIDGGVVIDYVELRMEAYPSIGDQLDMIYWDKINGTTIWEDTITAIKEKFQKPV